MRLTRTAQDDILTFDAKTQNRVHEKLKLLRASPRTAAGVTALVGLEGFRLKFGRVRVRFAVRDDDRTVIVTRVVPRNEDTYK